MVKFTSVMLAVLGFSASASAATTTLGAEEFLSLWVTWKTLHGKTYANVKEEEGKFLRFAENYKKIVEYNSNDDDVKLALNQFSDLSAKEFKSQYVSGLNYNEKHAQHVQKLRGAQTDSIDWSVLSLPLSVDWRKQGAVTPVKNQGQCGGCWAFSSTGSLEGLNYIKSGKLLSFSEQQLLDCDTTDDGCDGGLMDNAFVYVATNGIELESEYPYAGVDQKCRYDQSKAIKVNSGHTDVTPNSSPALKAAIVTQPVSVAIEADENVFQHYSSGVIKSGCGANLDHGVLAVGYSIVKGREAFTVKNSWGASWGDAGYVHIATDGRANGGAGVCGILKAASYPTA